MYVGPFRNENDVVLAKQLAMEVFGREIAGDEEQRNSLKNFLWTEGNTSKPEGVICADSSGEVIGLVRVVPKIVYRNNTAFRCAGVSSVCISPKKRGQGISRDLMNGSIDYFEKEGYDLSILIGRRAVDHYYTRFGYWGLSAYNKIQVKTAELASHKNADLEVRPVEPKEIEACNRLYHEAYQNGFGRMDRSQNYWKFIVGWVKTRDVNVASVFVKNRFIGYVVYKANEIYELALTDYSATKSLLHYISSHGTGTLLELHQSDSHPATAHLSGLDVTYLHRQCEYGGHMVKIINLKSEIYAQYGASELKIDFQNKTFRDSLDYGLTAKLLGLRTLFNRYGVEMNINLLDQF